MWSSRNGDGFGFGFGARAGPVTGLELELEPFLINLASRDCYPQTTHQDPGCNNEGARGEGLIRQQEERRDSTY